LVISYVQEERNLTLIIRGTITMKNSRVRIRIHHLYMDKEKKLVFRYIPIFGQNSSILHRSGHF
jgi:hypothetical protein